MRRALLLGLLAPAPAAAQVAPPAQVDASVPANSPLSLLLRQAQRWLDQGRPELAALSVGRALATQPNDSESLLMAARVEAARGNRDAALSYVNRLRNATGTSEQLAAAEAELRAATVDRAGIEEARRLVRDNRLEEAAAQYRTAFNQREPPPAYAREYFQALAATPAGREAGQRALGNLAAQPNADDRTLLANAEMLTYSPATRIDGITRLATLAGRAGVAAEAQRAWKQALGFYGSDPSAAPLLETYVARYPAATDIRDRLESARTAAAAAVPTPGEALRKSGFADLESGALQSGGQRFEAALALNPNDPDALGGLGVVRLRENRPADARALLERAIAADPTKAAQWRRALDGASYTLELAEARALLRRNDVPGADATLRRAVRREVEDATDAENMLGEAVLKRGDAVEAEQHFRTALTRRPGFGPAVAGLSQALRRQGRIQEADVLRPPVSLVEAGPAANPQIVRLRAEASRANDPASELALLNSALALAPNDPWLRLDSGRALRRQGREAEGRALVEELAARTQSADASYAAALLAQEAGRPADAEAFLARIPPQRRSADMARLQARVRNQAEVARARAMLATSPAEARRILLMLAATPDPSGGIAADAVRALGESGDRSTAAEAARVGEATNRAVPARIALAGALLASGLESESAALAARIDPATLTAGQSRDLAALRTGSAVLAADRLNEAGDQAAAFERLRPALASNAGDPVVELALARLYQGASRPIEAQSIAEKVLARDPRNQDARRAAVEAAIDAGDRGRATVLADEAQAMAPGDSRSTFLQARVARAAGNEHRARALLEEAVIRREQELGTAPRTGPAQGLPTALNPFQAGTALPIAGVPTPGDRISRDIARELAAVRDDLGPRLAAGAAVRTRSGTAGLDQLTEVSVPLLASFSPGRLGGRLTARVTPTLLDGGSLDTGSTQAFRFGSNAANGSAATRRNNRDTTATGLGLDVAYQRGDAFAVDVGTSPLGFRNTDILGGIDIAPRITESLRLRVKADRRAVRDSLLSYAGIRDPATAQIWGGVTQTGGRVSLEGAVGAGTGYVLGGYATLDGQNVLRNTRTEAGTGFSYPLWKQVDSELSAGADLVYFAFDNNQRGFTLGQGGYFSPQTFVGVNLPVTYRSRYGDLKYLVGGTIGFARFREEASPLYPTNPSLQSQAEAAARLNPLVPTRNVSQNKNGVTGGIRLEAEYPLTPTVSLKGGARYERAADFQETNVTVRLENKF